ncbi:MAG: hypothetical protein HZA66_16025 [Rhodopseudomonas palustris]|uniref:Uncharacterized protein n=1 Tax=Rhodopseudomonas palustris TaxID=1076 RepID=A0A933RYU0_RHOPL|nr:hypothetical protein [Rhodopseudomonas palustris]
MADIMSVLASGYTSAALQTPSKTKYVNVDPTLYQGTWTGTYSNTKKFSITVTDVQGFRAQVKYQSDGTTQYQSALIKDGSFRVGDTKFTLGSNGNASIRTAVTDPVTSQTSLVTGTAKRS